MGATKRYCRDQFQVKRLTLEHDIASDFYLSCWQSGQSPVPLLCFRLIIFLGCVGILAASIAIMGQGEHLAYWPIYMTHWGVFMITVVSGFAFFVSLMATIDESYFSDPDGLPWYARVYWVTYCITLPAAFFITIFYYSLLAGLDVDFAMDPVLDVFIHGINSVMMMCLLVTAQHPVHLLQFIYPFGFMILYLIFSVIYYFAGGSSPHGENWIYPMLDWSKPGQTTAVVFGCAFFLLIMHLIVIGLSELRDYISRRYVSRMSGFDIRA